MLLSGRRRGARGLLGREWSVGKGRRRTSRASWGARHFCLQRAGFLVEEEMKVGKKIEGSLTEGLAFYSSTISTLQKKPINQPCVRTNGKHSSMFAGKRGYLPNEQKNRRRKWLLFTASTSPAMTDQRPVLFWRIHVLIFPWRLFTLNSYSTFLRFPSQWLSVLCVLSLCHKYIFTARCRSFYFLCRRKGVERGKDWIVVAVKFDC